MGGRIRYRSPRRMMGRLERRRMRWSNALVGGQMRGQRRAIMVRIMTPSLEVFLFLARCPPWGRRRRLLRRGGIGVDDCSKVHVHDGRGRRVRINNFAAVKYFLAVNSRGRLASGRAYIALVTSAWRALRSVVEYIGLWVCDRWRCSEAFSLELRGS